MDIVFLVNASAMQIFLGKIVPNSSATVMEGGNALIIKNVYVIMAFMGIIVKKLCARMIAT